MTWQTVPIRGFAPDASPGPGVISASSQILPTVRGLGSGYSTSGWGNTFFGPPCGGAMVTRIDGTKRYFIGNTTQLIELVGSSIVDRSGSTYSAGTGRLWSISQLGDITLATTKGTVLQQISTGSTFAEITGAPKAEIVIVAGNPNESFVLLFDFDDGTHNYRDGVFWSLDYTNWTPGIAAQIGYVRMLDINGPWKSAVAYRNGAIAAKANALYRGTYVGGAAMWAWERISDQFGCIGKNAMCCVGNIVYGADRNGLWVYDGSYPRYLPGVSQWWTQQTHTGGMVNYERLTWEPTTRQLWVSYGYPSLSSARYIVFCPETGLWTQYGELTNVNGSAAAEYLGGSFAVQAGDTTRFLAIGSPPPQGWMKLGTFGDEKGMTYVEGARGAFTAGPSDSNDTWLDGKVWHGPSLRNVEVATYIPMVLRPPSELQNNPVEDRFIRLEMDFAAGVEWEMSGLAVNAGYRADGE